MAFVRPGPIGQGDASGNGHSCTRQPAFPGLSAGKPLEKLTPFFALHFFFVVLPELLLIDSCKATVVLRKFLLDDISLYSYAQVVSLCGNIGSYMVIYTIFLEGIVTCIAPKYSCHT